MTEQPKNALNQFLAAAKRIEAISSETTSAREMPNRVKYDVDKVVIRAEAGRYWNESIPQRAVDVAQLVKDQVHAEFRAEAERERDAKLYALAAELQSIRAALPGLAARAAIELGHQSRMLEHEANGETA